MEQGEKVQGEVEDDDEQIPYFVKAGKIDEHKIIVGGFSVMKNKKVVVIILLLCFFTSVFSPNSRQIEAKRKYVLYGYGKHVDAKYLVIKPKNNRKKLLVKGWAYKTKKRTYDESGKSKKYINKTFKVARNCKVVEVEMPRDHVYSFKKYLRKYKIRGDFAGIAVQVVIKNGKVYRIYKSA